MDKIGYWILDPIGAEQQRGRNQHGQCWEDKGIPGDSRGSDVEDNINDEDDNDEDNEIYNGGPCVWMSVLRG